MPGEEAFPMGRIGQFSLREAAKLPLSLFIFCGGILRIGESSIGKDAGDWEAAHCRVFEGFEFFPDTGYLSDPKNESGSKNAFSPGNSAIQCAPGRRQKLQWSFWGSFNDLNAFYFERQSSRRRRRARAQAMGPEASGNPSPHGRRGGFAGVREGDFMRGSSRKNLSGQKNSQYFKKNF